MTGKLLASGRDADIFEHGPNLVLRRSREGRSVAREARTMEYARSKGYPVPAVDSVSDDGSEMVMERLSGPSMLGYLEKAPWRLKACARDLAELHGRLHEIAAPDWVGPAPGPAGDRLLHLDLHPLNVMMTPKGAVVIDWTNAAAGIPAADVGLTWALMAAAELPVAGVKAMILERFRVRLVNAFLSHFDFDAVRQCLGPVVEWKLRDAHLSSGEQASMLKIAATAAGG